MKYRHNSATEQSSNVAARSACKTLNNNECPTSSFAALWVARNAVCDQVQNHRHCLPLNDKLSLPTLTAGGPFLSFTSAVHREFALPAVRP